MKTIILILALLTAALMINGCSDTGFITTTDNQMSDQKAVPFKGNWEGLAATVDPNVYPVGKIVTCKGNSTHLGLFDAVVNYKITYNYPPPYTSGGSIIDGTAEMVSANGDKVFLDEMEGYWWFTSSSSVEFNAGGVIAGGTGRFVNATGTWNGSGTQVFYLDNRPQETFFDWDGSITY
jgi:hypothetical protein